MPLYAGYQKYDFKKKVEEIILLFENSNIHGTEQWDVDYNTFLSLLKEEYESIGDAKSGYYNFEKLIAEFVKLEQNSTVLSQDGILSRFYNYAWLKFISNLVKKGFPPIYDEKKANKFEEVYRLKKFIYNTITKSLFKGDADKFLKYFLNQNSLESEMFILFYNSLDNFTYKDGTKPPDAIFSKFMGFFEKVILTIDVIVLQKYIFKGILDQFSVSKLYKNKQSKRKKILLLLPLFKVTHHKELPSDDFYGSAKVTDTTANKVDVINAIIGE